MTKPSTRRAFARALALAALAVTGCVAASAQEAYPSRAIEFVVPWGPGGGADQLARLVGKLGEPVLGQGMPVVNVPGGTGATGMAKLIASPADGHSIAIYIADSHALLAGDTPRWSLTDITPVAVMIQGPSFLFVPTESRFKSWADFEKEAKEKPGTLKVATLGFGSVDDFSLKSLDGKGVKVVQVPFGKPAERYVSILGGHADALYEQAGDVGQFLKNKQMRPLMIFGKTRHPDFPDVPTSTELGYNVSLPQFRSIVVRAGTPPDRVAKLSEVLTKIAATDEFKTFLKDQYADPNSFIDATKAGDYLAAQLAEMKALAGKQ
ncbi:MAG: tripartite tricarboxylate transporter substrate binding protein [Hyphomicrobiaceae bacterium]|nr:tripartite tricarboxylate transporter substrate binding protein [Hyphomicrobiaceae bacterium]